MGCSGAVFQPQQSSESSERISTVIDICTSQQSKSVRTTTAAVSVSSDVKLFSLPNYTLDDRADQLQKFEVVLLSKLQLREFEEMFRNKKIF